MDAGTGGTSRHPIPPFCAAEPLYLTRTCPPAMFLLETPYYRMLDSDQDCTTHWPMLSPAFVDLHSADVTSKQDSTDGRNRASDP